MTQKKLTRSEILANRQKVITFLLQPKRKKATSALDKGNGARCCIGHMCYSLRIKRNRSEHSLSSKYPVYVYGKQRNLGVAPVELIYMVGLNTPAGCSINGESFSIGNYKKTALTVLNDSTDATPQEIGKYLQSVIEGGKHTPWLSLDNYPETL